MPYFPMLRGLQEELRALLDAQSVIVSSAKVMPVVEPVANHPGDLAKLVSAGVRICMIENPGVGNYSTGLDAAHQALLSHPNVTPTMRIGSTTRPSEVAAFCSCYAKYAFVFAETPLYLASVTSLVAASNPDYVLICNRCVAPIIGLGRHKHVDIDDPFIRRTNAEYQHHPDEAFTSRPTAVRVDPSFAHYGDYSIVGGHFFGNGIRRPGAAAIHVVYATGSATPDLRLRHYVGLNRGGSSRGQWIADAIAKADADRPTINRLTLHNDTHASHAWSSFLTPPKTTSFGMLKRIALRHHLELMTNI